MHPILSDVRKLLWYMAAWLLTGIFIAKLLALADLAPWANAMFFAIPASLVYAFVASSAYYVCRSLPFAKRNFFVTVGVFGGTALISGFAWVGVCQIWNNFGRSIGEDWMFIEISQRMAILLFGIGFGLYLLSILAHDVMIAFENVRESERREFESRVLARDAELQLLRAQINPHFLFNSLNSISALTSMDAAGARHMTIQLAQFFRQSLSLSEKKKITLAHELELCENFLAIEKVRFGKKLGVEIHIEDEAKSGLIPPMILQPLLENAIKHGIRDLVDGGTLVIKCISRDGWLHISVENPVDAIPTKAVGNGLGLTNIRQRLTTIYGEKSRITWAHTKEKFLVEIVLPYQTSDL